MRTITTVAEYSSFIQAEKKRGKRVGFVPTMGALHEGHLSLVSMARKLSDLVVMSIFVNPLQFNNPEDLKKYPRTLERDSKMAQDSGVDVLFVPTVENIYPDLSSATGANSKNCRLVAGKCSIPLEGKFRPGHFDGVVTVVSILFHIVQPDVAIFGEKDFQQVKVIEEMVRELHFPIQIITAPTIREKDGLAMSSRNMRLNSEQRTRALSISRALFRARSDVTSGLANPKEIEGSVRAILMEEGKLRVEYACVVDRDSLQPTEKIKQSCQLVVAAWCDDIRLIDNIELKP